MEVLQQMERDAEQNVDENGNKNKKTRTNGRKKEMDEKWDKDGRGNKWIIERQGDDWGTWWRGEEEEEEKGGREQVETGEQDGERQKENEIVKEEEVEEEKWSEGGDTTEKGEVRH